METSCRAFGMALALGLMGYATGAAADCDPTVVSSMRDAQNLVASTRVDKPGQARVFAADGSEYPAGVLRWLAAELLVAEQNCRAGQTADARERVAAVQATLTAHARR